MKKLTPVILAVALALSVLGVLGTRIYQAAAYGGAAPEILFDSEVISVPTGADDAALLAGVTATDAEDGDVTASLVVEGVSGRNDDGTVQVTYAAFDSNHHVTKATRAVRPGLTGLAQVNGRNALRWEDRFAYDVDYVDHISFALDAKIVLMTLRCVFSREGISAEGSATMEAFTGTAKHPEEVQ